MDGQTDGWTDGQKDGDRWTNSRKDKQMKRQTDLTECAEYPPPLPSTTRAVPPWHPFYTISFEVYMAPTRSDNSVMLYHYCLLMASLQDKNLRPELWSLVTYIIGGGCHANSSQSRQTAEPLSEAMRNYAWWYTEKCTRSNIWFLKAHQLVFLSLWWKHIQFVKYRVSSNKRTCLNKGTPDFWL